MNNQRWLFSVSPSVDNDLCGKLRELLMDHHGRRRSAAVQ